MLSMIVDKLLRMNEAATLLHVTPETLRTWNNWGYIEAIVGKGGHRRFKWSEVKQLMHFIDLHATAKNCLIYFRVSTTIQREKLKRQRARLETYAVANGYIIEKNYEDVASGMNFKRKDLLSVFDYCQTHSIKAVIT